MAEDFRLEGGCGCGSVRYILKAKPLFVHCCHCRHCQQESGSAFALNAVIETTNVTLATLSKPLLEVQTPSDSGYGQLMCRCPDCFTVLWSHYAGSGPHLRFVRVGTLDEPDACPPDVHIFTVTKQRWVSLEGSSVPVVSEYYDRNELWEKDALERFKTVRPAIEEYKRTMKKMD